MSGEGQLPDSGDAVVKSLPDAGDERDGVRSLGWEDPLVQGLTVFPVFLPGKSHGQRSLVGYSPWGCRESGMTERLPMRACRKAGIFPPGQSAHWG